MKRSERQLLTGLRLSAQWIASPTNGSPVEVVRHLLAMQAQDYPGSLWSVALRTAGATRDDVEQAIADRQIVRSWPMRGTLHLTAAEDLEWMLHLTGERTVRSAAGRHRSLGLHDEHFTTAERVAEEELGGGRLLGRTELLAALAAAGLDVSGQRGPHLLGNLAHRGITVFGPVDGKAHTFALLREWVPKPRALVGDEALAELALRYLTSHGPSTDRDLAWWSSLTLGDARRGIAASLENLQTLEIDGTTYYHRPGLEPAAKAVYALPGFDEYVLGYADRSAQLSAEHFERIVPGGNGMFLPTIVAGGEIVGTWKRTERAKRVDVSVEPFASAVPSPRAALHRYGGFLGLPVEHA